MFEVGSIVPVKPRRGRNPTTTRKTRYTQNFPEAAKLLVKFSEVESGQRDRNNAKQRTPQS
jgi:hypothetical protein